MRISARAVPRPRTCCTAGPAWLGMLLIAAALGCLPSDLWFARMKVAQVDLALAALDRGLPQHAYRRQGDAYGVIAVRVGGYWCPLFEEQDA